MRWIKSYTITALLFVVGPVCAEPGFGLAASTGYTCLKQGSRIHGGYGRLDGYYYPVDAFRVNAGTTLSDFRGKGRVERLVSGHVGVGYALDYFHYVPWLSAQVILQQAGDSSELNVSPVNFGVEFGVDRLINRHWAIGFNGQLASLGGSEPFPGITQIGLQLTYRFETGDPFEP